ncbi:MAG: DHHA1 domain-containing protein, partial [bacterium]
KAIMKNHTAIHLLHSALRQMFGNHIEQAGSYVGSERLRFDFTHFAQLAPEELAKTEELVNKWVQESEAIEVEEMEFCKAKEKGAIALFDEKYGEKVRTVSVKDISMELCGGTHIKNTGQIGFFKIVNAGSTAAGVRRIEAVTGETAVRLAKENELFVEEIKAEFKSRDLKELREKLYKLHTGYKELEKKLADAKKGDMLKKVDEYIADAVEVNGARLVLLKFQNADKNAVRGLGDVLKAKMKNGVIVIANVMEKRVSFLVMVTKDAAGGFDASEIIKSVAAVCGGGGGGRKDMAEAGAKDVSKVDEALNKAREMLG